VARRYSCTRVGKEEEEEGEGEGGVDAAEALLGLLLLPLAVATAGRGRRVGAISYVLCWGERGGRRGRGGRRRGGQCSGLAKEWGLRTRVAWLVCRGIEQRRLEEKDTSGSKREAEAGRELACI